MDKIKSLSKTTWSHNRVAGFRAFCDSEHLVDLQQPFGTMVEDLGLGEQTQFARLTFIVPKLPTSAAERNRADTEERINNEKHVATFTIKLYFQSFLTFTNSLQIEVMQCHSII